MRLKYYLRGLGIGILVTALILGLVTKDKSNMTDEEIKARAHELGMVEQRTLADVGGTPVPDAVIESEQKNEEKITSATATPEGPGLNETPGEDTEELPKVTEDPGVTPIPTREPEMTPLPTKEPQQLPEATDAPGSSETDEKEDIQEGPETEPSTEEMQVMELVIVRGDSSYSVSKRLSELGLIADAKEYDTYLCEKGYDNKLNIGTYKLQKGQTWEEIAKIITRTR